jgi:hypothetical protein
MVLAEAVVLVLAVRDKIVKLVALVQRGKETLVVVVVILLMLLLAVVVAVQVPQVPKVVIAAGIHIPLPMVVTAERV